VYPEFEWDDAKARSNLRKHGVSFPQAIGAFRDPFAIEYADESGEFGEDRFILIGLSGEHLLTIVFTEREESSRIRIISARRSTKDEKEEDYKNQNPR
jgi:uncharacterized DUF497 family protein